MNMAPIKDEEIIYDAYRRYALVKHSKHKKVDPESDKEVASKMVSRSSQVITQLSGAQPVPSIHRIVRKAKLMYTQYLCIKDRNPSCINASLEENMNKVIREVCKREADMIEELRAQETDAAGIDIQRIFGEEKHFKLLGARLARDIVKSAIYSRESAEYVPKCVTVFIDESIRPVLWNEEGHPGAAGCYSYIICQGNLGSESQISEDNTIAQDVEFSAEHKRVDRITKKAIEKVLIRLAYELDYAGRVKIYTDNKSILKNWKTGNNEKLSKTFSYVVVEYIPRKENRKADRLCRNRMILDIPIKTYLDIVDKCSRADELEKRVREL